MAQAVAKVDVIILSLLMERPMHGYDLETEIQARHVRKWAQIGTSSIYQGLERLEQKGLAIHRLDASSGLPAKKVYTVTERGREWFLVEAKRLLSSGEYVFLDFNVGMAAYPYLSPDEFVRCRKARRAALEDLMAEANAHATAVQEEKPRHAYLLLKHAVRLLESERAWLDGVLAEFEGQDAGGQQS